MLNRMVTIWKVPIDDPDNKTGHVVWSMWHHYDRGIKHKWQKREFRYYSDAKEYKAWHNLTLNTWHRKLIVSMCRFFVYDKAKKQSKKYHNEWRKRELIQLREKESFIQFEIENRDLNLSKDEIRKKIYSQLKSNLRSQLSIVEGYFRVTEIVLRIRLKWLNIITS